MSGPSPESIKHNSLANRLAFSAAVVAALAVYGPMAVMSIGAGLVFLVWLTLGYLRNGPGTQPAEIFRDEPETLRLRRNFFLSTCALAVACVWSLVWAQWSGLEFFGVRPKIDWGRDLAKLWHIFFPFILLGVFNFLQLRQMRRIFFIWLFAAVLLGVFACVQHYFPIYKPLEQPEENFRGLFHATGFTGFHLSFVALFGFPTWCLLAAFSFFITKGRFRGENLKRAFLLGLSSLVVVMAHLFSYSKIAWGALPVTALLMAFLALKGWTRRILLLAVLLGILFGFQTETVRTRFEGVGTINDRYLVYKANLEMIRQFPWFGVGWHHNSDLSYAFKDTDPGSPFGLNRPQGFHSHAHNNFLDQWATTGTLGLIAFLAWMGFVMFMAWRCFRDAKTPWIRVAGLGLFLGWIYLHINGLTQTNFWDAKVLHQEAFVVAFLMRVYGGRKGMGEVG